MYRRVAQHLTLRTAIALTICIALLPIPGISFLISGAAQGQREDRKPKPRPGKPEGEFPDLEDVKNESHIQREASLPIPSTIRSRKNPPQPWDGRRVGDPGTHGALGDNRTERGSAGSTLTANTKSVTERRGSQTRRAHARTRVAPPPVPESSFLQNFFSWGLTRSPFSNETTYWNDQLRVAHANSQTALKLAAIELGRTLFESAAVEKRTAGERVISVDYYPTAADRYLSCSSARQAKATPIFEQYGVISRELENAILDNFAIQLIKDPDLTGKVLLNQGQYSPKFAAQKLRRIKNYLFNQRRVPSNRISFEVKRARDFSVTLYLVSKTNRRSSPE